MLIALVVGAILQETGSYAPIFVIAASAYLVAVVFIQLLAPKLTPVRLSS
jgi:ACS family hexuronate transporter-like MFS transporter